MLPNYESKDSDKRAYIEKFLAVLGNAEKDPFIDMITENFLLNGSGDVAKFRATIAVTAMRGADIAGISQECKAAGAQMILDVYGDRTHKLDTLISRQTYPVSIEEIDTEGSLVLSRKEALDTLYGTLQGMQELNQRRNAKYN